MYIKDIPTRPTPITDSSLIVVATETSASLQAFQATYGDIAKYTNVKANDSCLLMSNIKTTGYVENKTVKIASFDAVDVDNGSEAYDMGSGVIGFRPSDDGLYYFNSYFVFQYGFDPGISWDIKDFQTGNFIDYRLYDHTDTLSVSLNRLFFSRTTTASLLYVMLSGQEYLTNSHVYAFDIYYDPLRTGTASLRYNPLPASLSSMARMSFVRMG